MRSPSAKQQREELLGEGPARGNSAKVADQAGPEVGRATAHKGGGREKEQAVGLRQNGTMIRAYEQPTTRGTDAVHNVSLLKLADRTSGKREGYE